MLSAKFENIQMHKDESFLKNYAKLSDIINSFLALYELYLDVKIVHKILCSLPKIFHAKVTSPIDSKDVYTTKVEELVRLLTTYENKYKE